MATTLAQARPDDRAPLPELPHRRGASILTVAIVALGVGLRIWHLGAHSLSFDETFTAVAARRSPGDLFDFLRIHDAHPPLDYLLRMPFARTASDVLVRLPSVVFSSLALVVFALWMRARGRVGTIATALFAVSGFELLYGREARMYALMELVGVVVAVATDRWLCTRRNGAAAWVAAALLVGLFAHVSTLVLAAGVFWAAGLARDRAAWIWRVAVVVPVVVWGALWGTTFVHQAARSPASWIPRTTVDSFLQSVAQPVTLSAGLAALTVIALVGGAVLVVRRDRRLALVGLTVWAAPAVLAAVVGRFGNFLQPRTLAFGAWAPLLLVAVLLDAALGRSRLLGIGAAILLAVVLLPSTWQGLDRSGLSEVDATNAYLRTAARPGDVVAIRPQWMRSLVEWNEGFRRDGTVHAVATPVSGAFSMRLEGRPTGRVWLVEADGDRVAVPGAPCARAWTDGGTRIQCLRVPA